MYENLKHVIPGTAIGTSLDQLDLKLKEAQSNPRMKELLCQYKYEKVLDVAATLVAKGVFEVDQGLTLSYPSACKLAKIAKNVAEKGDDNAQSSGSGKENTSAFRSLPSTVSQGSTPTTPEAKELIATPDTATKQFDSLLQEHLEASKPPSATLVISPSLEPVKAAERVLPGQSTGEAKLNTETAEAVDKPTEQIKVPIKDNRGVYYERYLEEMYQILKPVLKDLEPQSRGDFRRLRRKISEMAKLNHELKEVCQQHGIFEVIGISYWLALRGLFLVDYVKFPRFQEAAREASKLFPGYTTKRTRTDHDASDKVAAMAKSQSADSRAPSVLEASDTTETSEPSVVTQRDHNTSASIPALFETEDAAGALKELPQPAPWESIKFPNMSEIEPSTSRDAIPDFWKMKFFPAQVKSEFLHDIESSQVEIADSMNYAYIRLPSMQELESCSDHGSELNVIGLRLLDSEPPESPTPMLVRDLPEQMSPKKAEIVADEQHGKPSKVLRVSGIRRNVNIKHLFKEFANVSPVNIEFDASKRVAVIGFTDVEAATKALKSKHGTFLSGKTLICEFGSENLLQDQVGIRAVAPEQPTVDHKDYRSSTSEPPEVEDTISVPTAITLDTVAQGPEETIEESVGEALTDDPAADVRYIPTAIPTDDLLLSELGSTNKTTPSRKILKKQRKVEKAKAAKTVIKEPTPAIEARTEEPVVETPKLSTEDRAEVTTVKPRSTETYDDLLSDGGAYNQSASSLSIDQTTFHDFEEDDLVYADEPSSLNELTSKAYQELLRKTGLRKGPAVDRVPPEIRQHATIPVPRTRAYYLPYSSQNRVLSGLQTSLEQVCFRYLQRRHPELLEETPTRWGIDSAHAFELNRYIYLLRGLIAPSSSFDMGPGGSRSLRALIRSIAELRHNAVHRFRVDMEALRFWAVDAVRLAELLNDPEAAKQFSSLVSSLEAQHNRMKAEKKKAEEDLLVTVRELAAKRAELLRVEREAMTAYEAAHKQVPLCTSELDKAIDSHMPLDDRFGIEWRETTSVEGTPSAKPTSGIFGRFKSWFGA